ncbi:MAG: aminopeptidase P family N-terminal domain-containing protein [Candidatus Accumulibacter sp.]|jgi:Xaa-Pro aminopeptidase|nr:aminopeptidase P family N-terminal domain-containing protein [Accumulibacter sp.]
MTIEEEFRIKLERLRSLMRRKELDGIFLKRQDDFAWLSCGGRNYVGAGDLGNCGLLVTADGHHAITNTIEAPRMLAEENLGQLGFAVRAGAWHDAAFEARSLEALVPGGRVGRDFGGNDIAGEIKELRLELTEGEIGRYREAGTLASRVMEETGCGIRPGETEYAIAARIMRGMEEYGLELVSCMVAADERIVGYRHPLPTGKRVEKRVQIGGNFKFKGLIVCMTRYVNFASVSDELRRQYRANQRIDCIYMANSIPGESYQRPLLAGKAAYEELGYGAEFDKHHQGGPIGYAGRDYRVDFTVKGTIHERQAFCWNPSITGTKSEDTVIVSAAGVEMISRPIIFPKVDIEARGATFIRPDILELC